MASGTQELFAVGSRVITFGGSCSVDPGSRGVYLGRNRFGALVDWDTASGTPLKEVISFDRIRNYR